jgi:dolichol-phosphate mannosyltransferase
MPHTPTQQLAIVVPLANEALTVSQFLARILAQLGPGEAVYCVVDRVSTDNTRELVEETAARDPRVVCVWAPENTCVVDAYFRGYRQALSAGYHWILEMDGGFSHLPEEIPRFRRAMTAGAEFAPGSRFMPGASYRGGLLRRVVSRGGTWLANALLGTRMSDMTSGYECFARPAMEQVLHTGVRSRGHFFQTEIRFMMRHRRCVEVPITYSSPSNRLGARSILEALRNLWALRRAARAAPLGTGRREEHT